MKNGVLHIEKGVAKVVEMAMPTPREGFVVVKVEIAPICIEHRAYETGFKEWFEDPHTYGHEGVGEIHSVGPGVSVFDVGERVIVYQGWACGDCWVCRRGLGATHCMNLKGPRDIEEFNNSESGGGGYCQYRLAPASMIQKIPENLSYKHASAGNCLIGCTYSAIREQAVQPEDYCLVSGVGFIGHATIVNLKYRGAKVIALGRTPARMEMARNVGVDHIVNPEEEDWLDQVRALTPQSRGVDFAFECSGFPYYQRKSLDALHHYGVLVLLGYAAHEPDIRFELNTEWDICWPHKTITGSFDVSFNDRQPLLEVLQDKSIQGRVDQMVSHQFPMTQAAEAFETIIAKQACKVHLLPQI